MVIEEAMLHLPRIRLEYKFLSKPTHNESGSMITQSGGGIMTRKNSQTTFAVVGAFILLLLLSYYSWSLTSENRALKRLVVNTYSKLKDMTSHKNMMEKKNTLLSNRMVEMEEQRTSEKQNAETEQSEKQRCQSKLEELRSECTTNGDKVKSCEDASLHREKKLLKLLKDVKLDSMDSNAEKDIFFAKIKHLRDTVKMTGTDFRSLQDKYTEVEKKKIDYEEKNLVLNMKLKECKKQKIIYINKEAAKQSDESKKEQEEASEEIENQDVAKKFPKKDGSAMKKQAEDAISKSKLKTTDPESVSKSEPKLVTDAVVTASVDDHASESEVADVSIGEKEDHRKSHSKDSKQNGRKKPDRKGSAMKSKHMKLLGAKKSKKLKKKTRKMTEKNSKTRSEGKISSDITHSESTSSPTGNVAEAGIADKASDYDTSNTKEDNNNHIDVENKKENVDGESLKDESRSSSSVKRDEEGDLDKDFRAGKMDSNTEKSDDATPSKEAEVEDKQKEKKKSDSDNDEMSKEANSLEGKAEDQDMEKEFNNVDELEKQDSHENGKTASNKNGKKASDQNGREAMDQNEKLTGNLDKKRTILGGLNEGGDDNTDETPMVDNSIVLPALKESNNGMTE